LTGRPGVGGLVVVNEVGAELAGSSSGLTKLPYGFIEAIEGSVEAAIVPVEQVERHPEFCELENVADLVKVDPRSFSKLLQNVSEHESTVVIVLIAILAFIVEIDVRDLVLGGPLCAPH